MKNKLTEIINRAKKLRKDFPNKFSKWTDYVKAAAKEKAKSGVKAVKKAAKKKIKKTLISASRSHFLKGTDVEKTHKDVKSHNLKINFFSGMSENEMRATAKKLFDMQTNIYLLKKQIKQTKNLKDKKPIQSEVRKLQKQYNALNKYYYTI